MILLLLLNAGDIARLVAKYRPRQAILALVVPQLASDGLRWRLEGSATARQVQIVAGVLPTLAAPSPSRECRQTSAIASCALLS